MEIKTEIQKKVSKYSNSELAIILTSVILEKLEKEGYKKDEEVPIDRIIELLSVVGINIDELGLDDERFLDISEGVFEILESEILKRAK